MSKRVTLTDDELYILRRFIQENLDTTLIRSYWVFEVIAHKNLTRLVKKLEGVES